MITKKEFTEFIYSYNEFEKAIDRISYAISGQNRLCDIYESDWFNAVGKMLDLFLLSHFTESACDLIYSFLFDNINDEWGTIIYEKVDKNLFEDEKEVEITLSTLDELWYYLVEHKEEYFIENE